MERFWAIVRDADKRTPQLSIKGCMESAEPWWDVENENIGPPEDFTNALNELNGEALDVFLDSNGGNMDIGMGIYKALKKYPGKVTVKVPAFAASAATLPLMGGSARLMDPGAIMMVHNPAAYVFGGADDLRDAADWIEAMRDAVVKVYMEGTGLPQAEVLELMEDETWMGSRQALRTHFATDLLPCDALKQNAYMTGSRTDVLRTARMAAQVQVNRIREHRRNAEAEERAALQLWATGKKNNT